MSGVDLVHILEVVAFLIAVWMIGRGFETILRVPRMVGYLMTGIVMGPQVLDMVPYASDGSCDAAYSRRLASVFDANATNSSLFESGSSSSAMGSMPGCHHTAWGRWEDGKHVISIWSFIGNVGVTMMIFHSGMQLRLDKVAQASKQACLVSLCGTALSIVTSEPRGLGLGLWSGLGSAHSAVSRHE